MTHAFQGSVRSARMRHLARHADPRFDKQDGPKPAKVLEHNYRTYRDGLCSCAICKADHARKSREYRRRVQDGTNVPLKVQRAERDARARAFLEDGCTYREAARSAGVGADRLARDMPGYDNNNKIWQGVLTQIKNNERLLEMHRMVWQEATYVKS